MSQSSIFSELGKRKVFQTAAVYVAVAWGATEIMVTVVEQLFLPAWVSTLVVITFVVGFPVAMFLAWTFDVTRDGIQRASIGSRRGKASIVLSMALLVAGTAGLFLLIKPSLQPREAESAAQAIAPNSVAVLPFVDAGLKTADAYLSEGLSDELRDQLGRSGIRIAARSSSILARQRGLDALSTAQKLRVANVVEGTMRRQGNKLSIYVELIEGSSGLATWFETFERGPNELLDVQQAIVEAVARQVMPDADVVIAAPATLDIDANELMLQARYLEQQVRDEQIVDQGLLIEVVRLYREAIQADPDSALAHSRLARALLWLGDLGAAEAPIFRAVSLNPNLSEVHNTMGEYYWARGIDKAGTEFARAVELDPDNANALSNYAHYLWLSHQSEPSELAILFRRALEIDPLSLSRHAALGDFLGKEGLYEQAQAVIHGIEESFDSAESDRTIGWLKELIGEYDQAIAWTLRARDREPGNSDHVEKLAMLYAMIGDFETALRLQPEPGLALLFQMRRYPELIDQAEFLMIDEPDDAEVRFLLAFAHNAVGQYESAIHILGSAGIPDTILNNTARSVMELEAGFTLINALAGLDRPETRELAHTLAARNLVNNWHGELGWQSVYRSCNSLILDRVDEALQLLAGVKRAARLPWDSVVQDYFCFQQVAEHRAYRDILQHLEERRAAMRKRLPATLAEFGVKL